jgi:hypothetical protein
MRVGGLELTSLADGNGFVSFQCRRALKISPGIRSPKWKEAAERVVAAQMARDGTKPGTPEREAVDREYEVAPCGLSLTCGPLTLSEAKRSGIVLLHDVRPHTAAAILMLLRKFEDARL